MRYVPVASDAATTRLYTDGDINIILETPTRVAQKGQRNRSIAVDERRVITIAKDQARGHVDQARGRAVALVTAGPVSP